MSVVPTRQRDLCRAEKLSASAEGHPVHPLHAEHDPAGGGRYHHHLCVCAGVCSHPDPRKNQGQNFFRIIFYIPNILSVVVISGIFSAIYKPENGMLNSIIGLFRDMTDPILWKGEKLVIPVHHHCHGLAGCGLLHGHVYGFHVLRCLPACTRAPIWTVPGG